MNEAIDYGEPEWTATEDDVLRAICTELDEELGVAPDSLDELRAICSELALGPMEAE